MAGNPGAARMGSSRERPQAGEARGHWGSMRGCRESFGNEHPPAQGVQGDTAPAAAGSFILATEGRAAAGLERVSAGNGGAQRLPSPFTALLPRGMQGWAAVTHPEVMAVWQESYMA